MRIWKRRHNIGLFVIDYLGLIEMARKFEARRLEIKHYSRVLKNLCKELNTPIIAVSQANDNEKTAESIDPLRDCDFALRCSKPIEDGSNAQLQTVNNENYNFTEDDFLVTIERSRHGKNKQNFVCGYIDHDFKEKDLNN
ncbi:MAG: DnaB-like helicase C-terminal domain-containing protein, partial [Ignavibacteriaceae bacterium]|nr:DnaB-like helicase C-terminal domain-containing protein [Ignavibacteriaceae bacterium]